ncbi:MAG: proton-conducting transporter membrane subunit [Kineosporiaceae bacterium]
MNASVPALDWAALSPVLVAAGALLGVLLLEAAWPRVPRVLLDAVALAGPVGAGLAVAWLARDGQTRATVCASPPGGVASTCSFVASPLTLTLQAVAVAATLGCLLLALDGPGARDRAAHHALMLAALTGTLALSGARDLITLVVAFETASLPAVGLVALRRDAQGAQGAITLLLTAVSSLGVLLLGVAMLYLATGRLHLDAIAVALSDETLPRSVRAVAAVGALLVVAGIGFKLSVVPFHLWTPDTYAGAPLPVAAFLSVVSKTAGAAAAVVVLGVGLPVLADVWAPVVGGLAVVTMTVGNLVALRQRVAVRLLAWSTVAQAGWVLVPLASAGDATKARAAVSASLGYLVAYVAASLAVFAVVVLVARHSRDGEEHTLDAYRGLARREPVACLVLGLGLAALAGLPPGVVGLVAKLVAVRPLVDTGTWFVAAAAAANVALALAYYVRWAALVVAPAEGDADVPTWRVRPAEGLVLGGAAAAVGVLSVLPQAVAGLVGGALR